MEKSFFDTYIGAAMEYDIFAGGDPNRPKSDRYTSQAAANADQAAVAEKEATDAGVPPEQPASTEPTDQPAEPTGDPSADPSMGDPTGGADAGADPMGNDSSMGGEDPMGGEQDPTADGMDEGSMDDGSGDPTGASPDDPNAKLEKKRKEVLFEVTSSLHGAVSNNINMLQRINPPMEDSANKIYYDVINQLQHCKDALYRIAVSDLQSGDYIDILRRITAISKVYELSSEAIKMIYPKIKEPK